MLDSCTAPPRREKTLSMHDAVLARVETPKVGWLWNGAAAAVDNKAASESTESFILS